MNTITSLTNSTLPNQLDFLPRFLRLSVANVLSNLVVPLAGLVSIAFLGHLSEIRYLAGAALATLLFEGLYYILLFLRQGTTGVTAQAVGRDDQEAILLVALRNGLIALGLGLLILILQYPLRELGFALVGGTPEVKAEGIAYFNMAIWGVPAVAVNYVLIGWLLGREESNKVLQLTVLGSVAKVGLDYLMIMQWGWATTGAGLSLTVSQYLMLLGGLIFFYRQIHGQEVATVLPKVWDGSALKSTFALNGNILINTLIVVSAMLLFSLNSTTMGTTIFTEDALLLQIVYLAFFFFEGLGFATESLAGNYKGQGANDKLAPLVGTTVVIGLVVGLTFALVTGLFPQTVFGLLTDHTEVTKHIDVYVWWLLSVLGFGSVSCLQEGYFLGLADGSTLRNASLVAIGIGFLPLDIAAWHLHNNHLLWLSLSMFMVARMVSFGIQLPRTFRNDDQADTVYAINE